MTQAQAQPLDVRVESDVVRNSESRPDFTRLDAESVQALNSLMAGKYLDNFATKADVANLRTEMFQKFGEFDRKLGDIRSEMHEKFGKVDEKLGEMKGEIGEMKGEIGEMKGELKTLRIEMEARDKKFETILYRGIFAVVSTLLLSAGGIIAFVNYMQ